MYDLHKFISANTANNLIPSSFTSPEAQHNKIWSKKKTFQWKKI